MGEMRGREEALCILGCHTDYETETDRQTDIPTERER